MKWMFLCLLTCSACFQVGLAGTSKVCQERKYITYIGTYNLILGFDSKKWMIRTSDAPWGGSTSTEKIISEARASMTSERGRALYALAANAMNNCYQVRLVDNFGTNCAYIDEIDVFRMP